MTNLQKHKDILVTYITLDFGVDKETDTPKLCVDLPCMNCLFNGTVCGSAMQEWLEKESEDKNENLL